MKILVTGSSGFIGMHTALALVEEGHEVIGLDNHNDYYDPLLKESRLDQLKNWPNFKFYKLDITDREKINELFHEFQFEVVVNLAAQAGVRNSIEQPYKYIDSNIYGFLNILEACRSFPVKHLIHASSSSVYGLNMTMPFSVNQNVNHPVSLYAASKASNELMAHSYSHLYQIPITNLRFFTVYGPWGRPDMALFLFTKAILDKKPIKIFNFGKMKRDFTYISDIVTALKKLINKPPQIQINWDRQVANPGTSSAPFKIFNIGNNRPVELLTLVNLLEEFLGVEAIKEFLPMQPGDVLETFADIQELNNEIGFAPDTPIRLGVENFVNWYKSYYGK